jgi:hypothetical protein
VRFLNVFTQMWVFVQLNGERSHDRGSTTGTGALLSVSTQAHADCFGPPQFSLLASEAPRFGEA